MAERVINQRAKAQQFLQSFAPVSASLDELVREKLECGQFPLTKTAWVKIVAMLVSLAGLVLFFAQSWDSCTTPDWFSIIFPVCTGLNFGIQLLFYLIFSFGGTVKHPGKWVSADIIVNLIFSLVGIIGSVMTVTQNINCKQNAGMHSIPGPLGIVGGALSVIGCAAIFLMYRYVEEEEEVAEVPQTPQDPRKSMHA